MSKAKPENTDELSIINDETIIEGKITASQDIRIDGKVIGEIESENKVIVGKTGNVNAEIKAKDAKIYGKLDGTIQLKENIYINKDAKVNADITAANLNVEEGAEVAGEIKIQRSKKEDS